MFDVHLKTNLQLAGACIRAKVRLANMNESDLTALLSYCEVLFFILHLFFSFATLIDRVQPCGELLRAVCIQCKILRSRVQSSAAPLLVIKEPLIDHV